MQMECGCLKGADGMVRIMCVGHRAAVTLAEDDDNNLCKSNGGCRFMQKPTPHYGIVFCGYWQSSLDIEKDGCNRWEAARDGKGDD